MLKVTTIGGGSSYTPELIEGFIKRYNDFPLDEIWLVDIEEGREKVEIVASLARRMFKAANKDVKVIVSFNRKEAIKDADFVTTQFRVGLLKAREKDELISNKLGLLGQETNGAAGHFKALRTIPIILEIVHEVQTLAPNAWIINFTNPAGIVSEAVNRYTNFKRFIGVCNVPIHLKYDMAKNFKCSPNDLEMDFIGLNHMVYCTNVYKNGKNVMDQAIDFFINQNSTMKNIPGFNWNERFIKTFNILPCSYHAYWYKKDEMIAEQMEKLTNNKIRAREVMKLEKSLFEKYNNENLTVKPKELEERGGAHYSDVACDVITSIYADKAIEHVVNIKNNGHIKNIESDVTLEMTAYITKEGAIKSGNITTMPLEIKGLFELFKAYEIMTAEAVITKSKNKALLALQMNPFIQDDHKTVKVFDKLFEAHEKYVNYLK